VSAFTLAVDGRAGLDRELPLDVDVALEASGDADIAVAPRIFPSMVRPAERIDSFPLGVVIDIGASTIARGRRHGGAGGMTGAGGARL
jgi:hypothetical protein